MNRTGRITIKKTSAIIPFLSLLIFFLFVSLSRAAFQENLWGARPAGMAGAFTALADDANAPFYNPAGVSLITRNELTFMYAQLYTGLALNAGKDTSKLGLGYLSFVPQIKDRRYGSFALSYANFTASNLMKEDTLTLSYAAFKRFDELEQRPLVAYGANLKYLRHSFESDAYTANDTAFNGGREADAVTADLGLMLRPNFSLMPGLKFGLAAQNITEPNVGLMSTDNVPARYTLGVAYQDRNFRLLNPALDITRRNSRTLVTLGWEGWMMHDTFAMRFGGNSDELGGGMGYQFMLFNKMIMRLDYALLWPLNVQGTTGSHRLSVTVNFGPNGSAEKKPPVSLGQMIPENDLQSNYENSKDWKW